MTLSIKKLNSLLNIKGLVPIRYYTLHSQYYIVDTVSIKNGESVLLYIPEKYKIDLSQDDEFLNSYLHFKIKTLPLKLSDNIVDKYGAHIDTDKYYKDIDLQESRTESKNIESMLQENYNHNIILGGEGDNKDLYNVRNIYKQLNRLKNCVKYVSYKLGIFTDKYICLTNEKNEVDCYYIKHHQSSKNPQTKLFVIISLETLIVSDSNIEHDVKTIYNGIQSLLEKNQEHHCHKFTQFLARKDEIYNGLQQLQYFKTRSNEMSDKYGKLLDTINKREQELQEKYESTARRFQNSKGITDDLAKNQALSTIEKELNEISERKDKTREKILELQDYISDVTLKVDEILFDNIVLLNTIHNNIDKLQKIFLE